MSQTASFLSRACFLTDNGMQLINKWKKKKAVLNRPGNLQDRWVPTESPRACPDRRQQVGPQLPRRRPVRTSSPTTGYHVMTRGREGGVHRAQLGCSPQNAPTNAKKVHSLASSTQSSCINLTQVDRVFSSPEISRALKCCKAHHSSSPPPNLNTSIDIYRHRSTNTT